MAKQSLDDVDWDLVSKDRVVALAKKLAAEARRIEDQRRTVTALLAALVHQCVGRVGVAIVGEYAVASSKGIPVVWDQAQDAGGSPYFRVRLATEAERVRFEEDVRLEALLLNSEPQGHG